MNSHRYIALTAAIAMLAACAHTQAGDLAPREEDIISRGSFITRLGVDTLAVERFVRTSSSVEGDIVWRSPKFGAAHYRMELARDLGPTAVRIVNTTPSLVPRRFPSSFREVRATYTKDSLITEVIGESTVRYASGGPPGALDLPYSWGLLEVSLAKARRMGVDSVRMPVVLFDDRRPRSATVSMVLAGKDSARMWNQLAVGLLAIRLTPAGGIAAADGRASTSRYVVERVAKAVDVPAITERFAVLETTGREFGSVISTRDTVRATVGRMHFVVNYTRPKIRGRDVFRSGVLGDTIWRTGANAATMLTVDTDIVLGDQRVPAGWYTLYTAVAPDNSKYELILNRQVGQWGTTYDRTRDMARVPLRVGQAPHTEAFTISVDQTGTDEGLLRLRWGKTELSVPVRAAR